jgi:dihydrofolate reductase
MKVTLVVAVAKNRVIGNQNSLPFYIPEDLKHFKTVTEGKTVLMGKNTYDSILRRLGKSLPNRISAVVTRDREFKGPEGVLVFNDLDTALSELSKTVDELMLAGGSQVYDQMLAKDKVDTMLITQVDDDVEGDVLFPEIDWSKWQKTAEDPRDGFSFITYERKR